MWEDIAAMFENYPSRRKVAFFLLSRGLGVNEEAKICLGEIEIPHAKVARALHIDRRAVDATAKKIREEEKLFRIFSRLRAVPFLKDVAPLIGLNVLVITPTDASKPGIMSRVSSKLTSEGISIRQAIADDPYFRSDPKLTIITDDEIGGRILNELKRIEGVRGIALF